MRNTAKDEKGVAILEFVLVFPLFIYVLYSLIAFGVALALKEDVTHASAEGARAALGAVPPGTWDPTATCADFPAYKQDQSCAWLEAASARVKSVLSWMGSNEAYVVVDPTLSGVAGCAGGTGTCITVYVHYDYANHPIVPPAPGLGIFLPSNLDSAAVLQVQ